MKFLLSILHLPAALWWMIKSPFIFLVRDPKKIDSFDIVFFPHRWAKKSNEFITVAKDPESTEHVHPMTVMQRVKEYYEDLGWEVAIVLEGREVERGYYGE